MKGTENEYPVSPVEEPVRPIRLWDAQERHQVPHRHFKEPKNAHMAALVEARWAKVGNTIEVFDSSNGKLLGQYTRRIDNVFFMGK